MSLNRDDIHTHPDGGLYRLIDPAVLMKHPDTGEWLAAVVYEDCAPNSPRRFQRYTTTEARWIERFKVRETPNQTDGAA